MPISSSILGELSAETRIYRIFPRMRFLQLFQEKRNALVLPTKWDDPFENVFLRADVINSQGERGSFSFHDDVYGQCWTLETSSDAMWQIYSRNKDAVRVRSTVGKLVSSLRDIQGDGADSTCFIGRVKYVSETRLKAIGRTIFREFLMPEAIARSLLVKRYAYKHENEVRIVYLERKQVKHSNGVYSYGVQPSSIIDQVMVDGRVSYDEFLRFKDEVINLTGFAEKQVKRSLLYRKPEGFVVEVE